MKWLKYLLAFGLMGGGLSAFGQTDAFNGLCSQGGVSAAVSGINSTNKLSGIVPSCTVTVYLTGTVTKATIYSNAISTPLSNPFTAATLGSTAPGQWLFFATTGVGYDVVMSGGIPPLTFTQPVTLTDLKAGGSSGGGTPVSFEHNGTLLGGQFQATPQIFNLNDTTPAADTGFVNVTFKTDSTGKVAGEVPSPVPSAGIQTQVVPPVGGQYVIVYPTNITFGAAGSAKAAMEDIEILPYCAFGGGSGFIHATGYALPSYVNPANVTAVYAFAISGNYLDSGSGSCFGNTFSPGAMFLGLGASGTGGSVNLLPAVTAGGAYPLQQTTGLITVTGANIPTIITTATGTKSTDFQLGASFFMPTEGLIVYYTGTAPPANNNILVAPPLQYANNTLGIDQGALFPASGLTADTIAHTRITATAFPAGSLFTINDGASATDCTTGGGSHLVTCVWDGVSVLTALAGSSGGLPCTGTCTAGVLPLFGSSGTSVTNSHIDETTNAGSETISQPVIVTGSTHGITIPAGTAPSGATGKAIISSDASVGKLMANENNTGLTQVCTVLNGVCGGGGGSTIITDNILLSSPSTGKLFIETDSIGLISHGGFPEKLATLLTTPGGNQSINAIGSASLADMLSCATAGAGNCTQDGTWPLTFPLGVTSNSKVLLEAAYNDLSNMVGVPTNPQLSYYFGGLKAWLLEFGIPDSQKIAANNTTYCTTTGTWVAATSVPGNGTFPSGALKTQTPGATIVCTGLNATDAGIIGLKTTGSTTATFTVSVVNAGTTYNIADPYTGSTTLNQTAAYTSAWNGISNFYAIGQSGLAGGYTTVTLTASSNGSDPVYVVAPYFISPSSSLQNFPAVEMMLESRAGCNGTCSSVGGSQHNDTNTNIMRTAQIAAVNELRSNGLNVSYFDPNATPSGFNSSDSTQTPDGTHPNNTGGQLLANVAFVNLNSAATTQDHFLPGLVSNNCAVQGANFFVSGINTLTGAVTCSQLPNTGCGFGFAHYASITLATATGGSDLTNYPLLLGFNGATTNSVTLANLKTVANGGQVQSSTGLDIVFCNASSSGVQLNHELVAGTYDPTTGAGEWYVELPTVSSTSGTVIYAFWGNASALDTSNVHAVWANGYQAVYHAGTSASLALTDSTSNANTLTNTGATATTGEFGGAFAMTTSQFLEDASPAGLPTGTNPRTLEAWAKIPTTPGSNSMMFGYGDNFGQDATTFYYVVSAGPDMVIWNSVANPGTAYTADTNWHHYVTTLPSGQTTANGYLMYIDGVSKSMSCLFGTCTGPLTTVNANITINGIPAVGGSTLAEDVDELRISSVARTAGWIATQYANQSNVATFATVGTIH